MPGSKSPKPFTFTSKPASSRTAPSWPLETFFRSPIQVLLIEDNPEDAVLMQHTLERVPRVEFQLDHRLTLAEGLKRLEQPGIDVVLLDLSLPDSSGFNTFQRTQNQAPMLPIIVLTGLIDDRLAARALLEGAQDYLVKGQTNPQILERSIRYAIERKRSQQALRESEERLRSLLDNAPTAIYLKDLEGRYLTANPQHETLVHRDKEALLGQTDHDIFEKGTADRLTANDREVLEHGKAMEFEEVLPREDGPHTYLSIKFPLYDSSGHPYAVCGISTDITHRKQMEANLRRTQAELMEAGKLAVLGQMAAGIGHELNQPLEAFQAYIDNIRILLKQNRIDEVEENIRVVSELVTRTGKIITRVKALAQKRSIQIKPVSLQKTIDYTLDFLLAKPRLEEVEIVKELPEREIFVQGDEVQLQQVFLNLISNAFHAMMNHKPGRLTLSLKEKRDIVELSFADTGPGIPLEILGRVFDPFITNKANDHTEGLGLGLSISSSIIRELGGTLSAHNRPEGGAVFTIHFPKLDSTQKGEGEP